MQLRQVEKCKIDKDCMIRKVKEHGCHFKIHWIGDLTTISNCFDCVMRVCLIIVGFYFVFGITFHYFYNHD